MAFHVVGKLPLNLLGVAEGLLRGNHFDPESLKHILLPYDQPRREPWDTQGPADHRGPQTASLAFTNLALPRYGPLLQSQD